MPTRTGSRHAKDMFSGSIWERLLTALLLSAGALITLAWVGLLAWLPFYFFD